MVCASVPAAEVSVTVLSAVTAIVPVVVIVPHPPVKVTVYVRAAPATVGVPLIVTHLQPMILLLLPEDWLQ